MLKRITSAESIDVLDVAEGFIQDCMPKTHDTLYARADKKRAELLAAKEESTRTTRPQFRHSSRVKNHENIKH